MIRFIDIRNQGTGERFAFYNTVNNKFLEFDYEQAWTNWNEFEIAFLNEEYRQCIQPGHFLKDTPLKREELERFKSLCPEWVFDDKEDDIEGFYGINSEDK